jgi:hypothetical protein
MLQSGHKLVYVHLTLTKWDDELRRVEITLNPTSQSIK